jgi:hypothetical protein
MRNRWNVLARSFGLPAAMGCALSVPAAAQWLSYPTPGIPRTAAGKPNLTAQAPRTPEGHPDLTGFWQRISPKYERDVAADLKPGEVPPWAEALVQGRMENLGFDHMSVQCLPWGPSSATSGRKTKLVQTPNLIVMLDEDLTYRQVFLDGRPLETDPNPSWQGYSVGHWDGDTLVVESSGFNDRTWLDRNGHPHTDALRVTERYRRTDFGHLEIQVTLTDPKVYAKPITVSLRAVLAADTDLLEDVCNEDTSRRSHYIGKASDDKKLAAKVAPEILAKYAGIYEEKDFWGNMPHPRMIEITVSGDTLYAELKGRGKTPLTPFSETNFQGFFGLGIEFVRDANGVPTHLNEMHVSGNYRFMRKN